MGDRTFSAATWLLSGLAIGALLGRQWQGEISDVVLIGIALVAMVLVAMQLVDTTSPRRRVAPEESREPTPLIAGKHVLLVRREGKCVLRVQDLGRLKFVEFALVVPHFDLRARWTSLDPTEAFALVLFALSLGVYGVTRLFALDQFPIYFFTDEAIHPVLASDLIQRGFRDAQGNLFPAYFQNGLYWNLSLSVYLHVLPVALFGKSIVVTRATSVVIGIFGAAAVGLILKLFLKAKHWWLGVLFLSVAPAWFLHSRTAFETALMVSFYAWFLLCYLLYRYRSPTFLFPALLFGAATFYSYANGQAVMAASGVLLLLSDFRYHLRHWRTGVWGVFLLVVLMLPYVSFRWQNPDALSSHLRILNSYWIQPIPLQEKLARFISAYTYGLSPQYWFLPNEQDLVRHRMKDYGNLSWWTLPFFVVGAAICLRRVRSSVHRAILLVALAAPFGSALAEIAITRVLMFVIPASIFATLGLDTLIERLESPHTRQTAVMIAFVLLSFANFAMLHDALVDGPTWYTNYGLYGMQWGTRQLFGEEIPRLARDHPTTPIYLTPTWANGTDVFLRFFSEESLNIRLYNVDHFLTYKRDLEPNAIWVMTKEEYDRAQASKKFKGITVEQTLKYPDGSDGFYFARLAYVDNVEDVFAAEREARRHLATETVTLNGETMQIAHSVFDGGRVQDLFDGNPFTLARGMEANPLILELTFAQPRPVSSLQGIFGRMNFQWTILLYASDTDQPVTYLETYTNLPGEPRAEIIFDQGPARVSKLRMEVLALDIGEPVHVHIRELSFK